MVKIPGIAILELCKALAFGRHLFLLFAAFCCALFTLIISFGSIVFTSSVRYIYTFLVVGESITVLQRHLLC